MTAPTKVAVVIGSGRSMTSGVANGLHHAGFPMVSPGGRMVDPSPSNPLGHYEDRRLVELNDRVLGDQGYWWDDPPPITHPWRRLVSVWGDEATGYLVDRFNATGQFGMKDPRVTILWPLWAAAFRRCIHLDPIIVSVSRDRDATIASLMRRDHIDKGRAEYIVDTYHDRTTRIVKRMRDDIVWL